MSQAADSAGISFSGREFRPHPFDGDDGSAPPALAEALSLWEKGRSGEAMAAIVEALRASRVLVPLLADAGDVGHTAEGKKVEKTQELSIVTVEGPDGLPVALMFSDVLALSIWRTDSRPVPVEATKVAAWVIEDQMARAVLNPGSASECVIRRGGIVSLLSGEPYTPPVDDPAVERDIALAFEGQQDVSFMLHSGWDLLGGNGPDLIVEVALPPGLSADQLRERQAQWASVWAASPVLNRFVDGIRLKIVAS
jgi:hypothetical protein